MMPSPWQPVMKGRSGQIWVVDEPQNSVGEAVNGHGRFWFGWREDDPAQRVWVQKVMGPADPDDPDQIHVLTAWERGQIPTLRECSYVRQVLDFADPFDLYLIHELADTSLESLLGTGGLTPADVDAIRENIAVALEALHSAGYVHCDVRESNVLRVDGVWKLSDLGGSVPLGETFRWYQREGRYRRPGFSEHNPAGPVDDWYAYAVVMETLAAANLAPIQKAASQVTGDT
jgi:serine/threonine protein kinase